MKKIALISLAIMASLFPLCSMAQQGVKVDVHTGANLSGFAGGKSYAAQDRKMKMGASVGVGVSYEKERGDMPCRARGQEERAVFRRLFFCHSRER